MLMFSRRSALTIVLLLLIRPLSAQLTVDQVVGLSDIEGYEQFDAKARTLGFSFDERIQVDDNVFTEEKEGQLQYIYVKRHTRGDITYTSTLSFIDFSDGKPVITYGTTSVDLVAQARAFATKYQYKSTTCATDFAANQVGFCWESTKRKIVAYDSGRDGANYRAYQIRVFRR
jgi:hypothetical protein